MITRRNVRRPVLCDGCGRRATKKVRRGYYRASFHGDVCVCLRCANMVQHVEAQLRDDVPGYSSERVELPVGGRGTFILPLTFR